MDTLRAIIEALDDRLTGDAALQALFPGGEVALYVDGAVPEDSEGPYIVHDLELAPQEVWAWASGAWSLNIWDHATHRERLYAIHARLIALMDRYTLALSGGESVIGVRFELQIDTPGPSDESDWQRQMMQFAVWCDRKAEIGAILSR